MSQKISEKPSEEKSGKTIEKQTPNTKFLNKKWLILVLLAIPVLVVAVYLFLHRSQNLANVPTKPIQNSMENSSQISSSPKLAYIYTFGIKLKDDSNPDLGGVFIVNTDGTNKRKLASIDKSELQNVLSTLTYSPVSNELLVNTDNSLIGININTGQKRILFDKKTESYELSNDYKYVCITSSPQKIELGVKDLHTVSSFDCRQSKQPYMDQVSMKSVDIKSKETTTGGAGTFTLSSEITIINQANGNKNTFAYDKEGSIDPLFISNGYLYFKVVQCCASTPFIGDLMQMNLDSGEISSPSSLPTVYENIKKVTGLNSNFSGKSKAGASIWMISVSPHAKHFLYQTVFPEGDQYKTSIHDLDIATGKERLLQEYTAANAGNPSGVAWTTDDRYVLLSGKIYDINSGKNYVLNSPDSSTNFYEFVR